MHMSVNVNPPWGTVLEWVVSNYDRGRVIAIHDIYQMTLFKIHGFQLALVHVMVTNNKNAVSVQP